MCTDEDTATRRKGAFYRQTTGCAAEDRRGRTRQPGEGGRRHSVVQSGRHRPLPRLLLAVHVHGQLRVHVPEHRGDILSDTLHNEPRPERELRGEAVEGRHGGVVGRQRQRDGQARGAAHGEVPIETERASVIQGVHRAGVRVPVPDRGQLHLCSHAAHAHHPPQPVEVLHAVLGPAEPEHHR